jgi:hypothetical protein
VEKSPREKKVKKVLAKVTKKASMLSCFFAFLSYSLEPSPRTRASSDSDSIEEEEEESIARRRVPRSCM